MIGEALIHPERDFSARLTALPAALLVHGALVLALVALPILRIGPMPKIEMRTALLVPPIPVPPPLLPQGRGGGHAKRIQAVTFKPDNGGRFAVPVAIPDVIADEAIDNGDPGFGIEGGVEGIAGADIGKGIMGEVLGRLVGDESLPVQAGAEVRAPRLIRRVAPEYPEIARQARVAGTVVLEATTDIYGRVRNVRILRSVPLLDEAAAAAVRSWVYEPLILNGRPRGVTFIVTVRFELN